MAVCPWQRANSRVLVQLQQASALMLRLALRYRYAAQPWVYGSRPMHGLRPAIHSQQLVYGSWLTAYAGGRSVGVSLTLFYSRTINNL